MYIAFEGVDTAGKSTQIEALAVRLGNCVVTKEPGGTPLGTKLRAILLEEGGLHPRSEALLFLADRAEHTERVIRPNRHRLILSDRSLISGIAYAAVNEEIPLNTLITLNRFAVDDLLPDLAVLLKLDRATLAERMAGKTPDAIESRGAPYLLKIQEMMERVIDALAMPKLVIDAGLPVKEITDTIENHIKERL